MSFAIRRTALKSTRFCFSISSGASIINRSKQHFRSCRNQQPPTANARFASSSTVVQPSVEPQDQPAAEDIENIDPHHDIPQCGWDDQKVSVGWGDGMKWSRYHNIWLRDHCRCSECFHPITKQRLVDTFEIPADIHPNNVESKENGLEVTWPASPPHVSLYPWSWLRDNSYDPPAEASSKGRNEKILWGARISDSPPTVTCEEVMKDDAGLLRWLQKIDQFGFCFVEGVPTNPESTEALCRRIAFIRETQYGGFWDFTSDLSHGDTAYTNIALKAHTDNTYYTDPAGLQLFHLLSHTDGEGGATLLVDGFYVASILKEINPSAFDILSRVRIPAHAAGDDRSFYKPGPTSAGYPLITLDPNTDLVAQVRYNNDDRSVISGLEGNQMEEWYQALRAWNKCLTSHDSEYWVQLKPGTAVVVDNYRVLHGRSAFSGKRRMCGAYIGADEYRSKLTVLQELAKLRGGGGEARNEPLRSVWDPRL
ncbi:hypothetical protein FRB95_007824 [Tulasnella sp. JGI-2019a]|nr:hypothetical protein FRB95_007824 [Tulasnella sp. JGI-2019a]